MTVYQFLKFIAAIRGIPRRERRDAIDNVVESVELHSVLNKSIDTLSKGFKRRVGIAQALIGDPELIIVDEPTAGLDPEERNRFHNLLAEIGENVVVILSTHIVEDVADLCPNMVIINHSEIITGGKPADLVSELSGKIWTKTIQKDELDACRERHAVISSRLSMGNTVIRVLADGEPEDGFGKAHTDLEDVYFATLYKSRATNAQAAA
jgi:ABC-type multidrug transport system ATPase subunit